MADRQRRDRRLRVRHVGHVQLLLLPLHRRLRLPGLLLVLLPKLDRLAFAAAGQGFYE